MKTYQKIVTYDEYGRQIREEPRWPWYVGETAVALYLLLPLAYFIGFSAGENYQAAISQHPALDSSNISLVDDHNA